MGKAVPSRERSLAAGVRRRRFSRAGRSDRGPQLRLIEAQEFSHDAESPRLKCSGIEAFVGNDSFDDKKDCDRDHRHAVPACVDRSRRERADDPSGNAQGPMRAPRCTDFIAAYDVLVKPMELRKMRSSTLNGLPLIAAQLPSIACRIPWQVRTDPCAAPRAAAPGAAGRLVADVTRYALRVWSVVRSRR
jgi:hypothetical protein